MSGGSGTEALLTCRCNYGTGVRLCQVINIKETYGKDSLHLSMFVFITNFYLGGKKPDIAPEVCTGIQRFISGH